MKGFTIVLGVACLLAAANAEAPSNQLMKTAYEFMARASSTSEVLTLNLTNLAILIGLKLLFFALGLAGLFGTGAAAAPAAGFLGPNAATLPAAGVAANTFAQNTFAQTPFAAAAGRSSDDSSTTLKQSEMTGGMCFIMYTSGEIDKLSCVQRTACEDPETATNYLTAAKMWHKMHKLMKVIPFNEGYVSIMNAVEDATEHALNGGDCSVYKW